MIATERNFAILSPESPRSLSVEDLLRGARESKSILVLGTGTASRSSTVVESLLNALGWSEEQSSRMTKILGTQDSLGPTPLESAIAPETRAWIEAGDLFERLLAFSHEGKSCDYIFCLDPWASLASSSVRHPVPQNGRSETR